MGSSTVIITGANRGIGLALSKTFLLSGQWKVLACCRSPDNAPELQELANTSDNKIEIYKLDVKDAASVMEFSRQINGQRVDVLLNNEELRAAIINPHLIWISTHGLTPFKLTRWLL